MTGRYAGQTPDHRRRQDEETLEVAVMLPRLKSLKDLQETILKDVENIPLDLLPAAQRVYQKLSCWMTKEYHREDKTFGRYEEHGKLPLSNLTLEGVLKLGPEEFEAAYADYCGVRLIKQLKEHEEEIHSNKSKKENKELKQELAGIEVRDSAWKDAKDSFDSGRYEEAKYEYDSLLTRRGNPKDPCLWLQRGRSQEKLGDYIGAGASFLEYMELSKTEDCVEAAQIRDHIVKSFERAEMYLNVPTDIRNDAFEFVQELNRSTQQNLLDNMDLFFNRISETTDIDDTLRKLINILVNGLFEEGRKNPLIIREAEETVFSCLNEYIHLNDSKLPEVDAVFGAEPNSLRHKDKYILIKMDYYSKVKNKMEASGRKPC